MIYLDRFRISSKGTLGELSDDSGNLQQVYTIERPPTGDHPCIPPGVYDVEQYNSPTKGDVWIIKNPPPGRFAIEIHPANDMNDLLGCIGVGDSLGCINGLPAVLDSKKTFDMLKKVLPAKFQLTITNGD